MQLFIIRLFDYFHLSNVYYKLTFPLLSNRAEGRNGVLRSRVGGRRRNLSAICWRKWPGRKSGLITSLLYELGGVQSSRVDGRRRSLCHVCWRKWPGRKSGLITSLLYELGGVQSSRVGGRRRSLCHEC